MEISKELADLFTKEYPFIQNDKTLYFLVREFKMVKTQDKANKLLKRLYEWADENLVWLGI